MRWNETLALSAEASRLNLVREKKPMKRITSSLSLELQTELVLKRCHYSAQRRLLGKLGNSMHLVAVRWNDTLALYAEANRLGPLVGGKPMKRIFSLCFLMRKLTVLAGRPLEYLFRCGPLLLEMVGGFKLDILASASCSLPKSFPFLRVN